MHPLFTPDGSLTLYSERFGQHYHSRHGAATQARVVYLEGTRTHLHPAPRVLEVGFGAGLNFLTTLSSALERGRALDYLAFEFDPLPAALLAELHAQHPLAGHPLWQAVLKTWGPGGLQLETPELRLEVRVQDVTGAALPERWASALYLDGFSPAANPEVWTPDFCARLAAALVPGGWLATYSAAGAVRRALAAAGLEVHKHRGLAGKREFVTACRT
ncbi:tRNA U34 5-methylaminomethyl-2-thiouridine-forming methyltransferase MnmC [Deinobacterium chartae]|uniref:tRNA U34 5-methylaminomethyl-2-thiouridine-forming methyltransferase MnmC n=1 Tax=Deinobacterium chartae TaxID=521158 RepID=A0A841I0S6_9DEIO|nr:tRNA (5-methylaminomethyl-2-thiouridine)(34)-methyltransferase MnmD [Deinobacterium chartae]MBB6097712.1 tRNA U34 5-methylaminomethyl-2-thiouridine-forming methyltransferase MnmC [Deinobacterium chartae]